LVLSFTVNVMVFNATFNNISVISWWLVLLVEETGIQWENHWPAASHCQTLSHNVVFNLHKLNTCLFRTKKLDPWRFGLDRFHCSTFKRACKNLPVACILWRHHMA
jgi:hypothetical protein